MKWQEINGKTRDKGKVLKKDKIIANAVQILDGDQRHMNGKVPIILLNYNPPPSAKEYAQGERFALWIKFEDAEFRKMEEQFKRGLREITIWFDFENMSKLRGFLL